MADALDRIQIWSEAPETLADAGKEIRQRLQHELFDGFEETDGWSMSNRGHDRVWYKVEEGFRTATFKSEAILDGDPTDILALIKESDLSTLAGKISTWNVHAQPSPAQDKIHYVTEFPGPFKARSFDVIMTFGTLEKNNVCILGHDDRALKAVRLSQGSSKGVSGNVLWSAYHLTKTDGGYTRVRRTINLDLQLSLPKFMMTKALVKNYLKDFDNLRWSLNHMPEDLKERMDFLEMYKEIRSHFED